uniref:Lipoprotein n=1 Tax=Strongyloides venezuelensis TaxID=75913 RepID=A0A0K0G1W6_STRVS
MKHSSIIFILISIGTIILLSHGCNIKLKVTSDTENEFKFMVTVPSIEYESEPLSFLKQKETKVLHIKGKNCNQKKWKIQTWKRDEETGTFVRAKNFEAKFDGNGYIRMMVGDDYRPWVNDREGIFCSEGQCA